MGKERDATNLKNDSDSNDILSEDVASSSDGFTSENLSHEILILDSVYFPRFAVCVLIPLLTITSFFFFPELLQNGVAKFIFTIIITLCGAYIGVIGDLIYKTRSSRIFFVSVGIFLIALSFCIFFASRLFGIS